MSEFVVTLPRSAAADPHAFVERARDAGATRVEIRGDLTPGVAPFEAALPLLFSPRGTDLPEGALCPRDLVDLDPQVDGEAAVSRVDAASLVLSFHDHAGTPSRARLVEVGRALRDRQPRLVKLAATPRNYAELALLEDVRTELRAGGPVTVHAMGELAALERTRSPWRNAFTYAALEGSSAPGQLNLARYRELAGEDEPAVFGVYGSADAVARSGGPPLHERWFAAAGVRAVYLRFPARDPGVDLRHLGELGVRGLSVTTPGKAAAFDVADAWCEESGRMRTSNTLVRDGSSWIALNSDVTGLLEGYPQLRDLDRVSVVGTGGVVPAVLLAGSRLGWRATTLFGRNEARMNDLAGRFGAGAEALERLPEVPADLVVWCLPIDRPDLALPQGAEFALDLRYGRDTEFLAAARAAGRTALDGAAMFEHQARGQSRAFTASLR